MARAVALAADIASELLSQRPKEAWRARQSAGSPLGRPQGPGKSPLDPSQRDSETLLAHGSPQTYIAHPSRVTAATVARWRQKRGVEAPIVLSDLLADPPSSTSWRGRCVSPQAAGS